MALTTQDGEAIDGYHGLAVTGRSGPIDGSLSESIVLRPPVPTGRARDGLRGLYFRPETWDGSDVFVPQGSGYVILTDAVAGALHAGGVTKSASKSSPRWNVSRSKDLPQRLAQGLRGARRFGDARAADSAGTGRSSSADPSILEFGRSQARDYGLEQSF